MEHLAFYKRSSLSPRQNSSHQANNSHKAMKQNLDRMDSTVTAIPQTLTEYMDAFNSFCLTGIKFASLLETVFQDTPILLMALRFREACEQMNDKCSKSTLILKNEVVPPVKRKLAPSLSQLRNRLESHAKALSKHESYARQLENLSSMQNPNKQKMEQVEGKFQTSAKDFAKEDSQLAEALNEVQKMRVEVMGPCFLGFLETQSKLLTSASDLMTPLGAYKEVGKGLSDSSNSAVKEATVGWLAAAQVNQNLRSFGGLSRNDVQCMMYNHSDGLPSTISTGLNIKVDQLLKKYVTELKQSPNRHHKVMGGFQFNPKGIELALRDCCSELEALGAGAPHAETKEEKEGQISRDVPRTSFKIQGELFGCAMGENAEGNIREKLQAITKLLHTLHPTEEKDRLHDYACHLLNESCTTVTNTAAKTAVQLVFGKANLVLVRPSPLSEDNRPIDVCPRHVDLSVNIVVHSSWWLVEDYVAFAMLSRRIEPSASLGVVDVTYTQNIKLQNFLKQDSPPELPSIAVTYREPPERYATLDSSTRPVKDKDHRFLHNTLNRTLKSFLHRTRPHSPGSRHRNATSSSGQEQEYDRDQELDSGSKSMDKGGFRSYVKASRERDEREETSSGSSSHSGSPGGGERGAGSVSKEEDEEEEEERDEKAQANGKRDSRHLYNAVGGAQEDLSASHSSQGTLLGSGSTSGEVGVVLPKASSYGGGRGDSLGRGLKPNYYQLKRYPSNDSMSSQSTLVSKLNYEHEDGLADILRPTTGQGLTQSNVQDHLQSEARKSKYGGGSSGRHGRSRHHHHHHHQQHHHHHHHQPLQRVQDPPEEGEGELYEYENRKEEFLEDGEDGGRGGGEREERRGEGQEDTVDDEDSTSPHDMHVSPAGDDQRVSIASDAEVQNVIEFLSRKSYDEFDGDRGTYPGGKPYDYQDNAYLENEREWSKTKSESKIPEQRNPAHNNSDNSSSGSSGVGTDDGYGGGQGSHDVASSRSTSISPGGDGKEYGGGGDGRGKGEGHGEEKRYYNPKGSYDSGINLQPRSGGKKKGSWDRDASLDQSALISRELSATLDFSKGFGLLISSDGQGSADNSYGMGVHLDYQKRIGEDSDSDLSGRESNPPVSTSSSEPQSPINCRPTKSVEDIQTTERSSSRSSTHSMTFVQGPTSHLDDLFNHAPGSQLPHHGRSGQFSNFEYEDRLSQGSYDGGRGSHSQGWDWGNEPKSRTDPGYTYSSHSYGYEDSHAPSPGRAGSGRYDSSVGSHSQQERSSRSMHRGPPMSRSQEDYSPSPGPPPFERRPHNMMPPGGPGGPPPPPHGGMRVRGPAPNHHGMGPPPMQGGPGPPHHQGPRPLHPPGPQGPPFHGPGPLPPHHGPMGPPPPHHGPGMPGPHPHQPPPPGPMHGPPMPPPPHHGGPPWYDPAMNSPRIRGPAPPPPHHPVHDNRFHPIPFGGRSNTPSDAPSPASLHSMSPGPSPHPTPPPTPPPNMGLPPHHGPPIPGPHHHGGPPMGMHHMPGPPPMRGPGPRPPFPGQWEGGLSQRDFGPPPGGRPPNHSANMPGPPLPPMGLRYPNHNPEWDNWQHH